MTQTPTLDERRNQLIDEIAADRKLPAAVEKAMRTVARHQHLPGLPPERAYTDEAVSIKENPGGPLPLSLASVPSIVAMMLAQLDAQPGPGPAPRRSGRAPRRRAPSREWSRKSPRPG